MLPEFPSGTSYSLNTLYSQKYVDTRPSNPYVGLPQTIATKFETHNCLRCLYMQQHYISRQEWKTWVSCTEPRPQPQWTPLGKIEMLTAHQASSADIRVWSYWGSSGWMNTNPHSLLQTLVENLSQNNGGYCKSKGELSLEWDVQQAHGSE